MAKRSLKSIEYLAKCKCGALTATIGGKDYSMRPETFRKIFGVDRVPNADNAGSPYYSCNHCVNHWGVDLCACGSGKSPEKCKEGFSMCGKPMQVIGRREYW